MKNIVYKILVIVLFCTGFSSCGGDDEPNNTSINHSSEWYNYGLEKRDGVYIIPSSASKYSFEWRTKEDYDRNIFWISAIWDSSMGQANGAIPYKSVKTLEYGGEWYYITCLSNHLEIYFKEYEGNSESRKLYVKIHTPFSEGEELIFLQKK